MIMVLIYLGVSTLAIGVGDFGEFLVRSQPGSSDSQRKPKILLR